MQASQIPTKFQKAFAAGAAGANIRAIPVTSSNPDAASQTLGWPPATMTAEGAGGVPPDGRDMNGLDNMLSAWAQWFSIGGPVSYDSVIQAAIGGYPARSTVQSVATPGNYWQSTTDNNTTNPDTGGSGWIAWPAAGSVPWSAPPMIGNVTPNSADFTDIFLSGRALITGAIINGGVVNSSTDLQINGVGFAHSFTSSGGTSPGSSASGYQQLPSGMIIQWGRFNTATGNGDVLTLPIAFPTNYTIVGSSGYPASGNPLITAFNVTSLSQSTVWSWRWNGSAWVTEGDGVCWVAIGY